MHRHEHPNHSELQDQRRTDLSPVFVRSCYRATSISSLKSPQGNESAFLLITDDAPWGNSLNSSPAVSRGYGLDRKLDTRLLVAVLSLGQTLCGLDAG